MNLYLEKAENNNGSKKITNTSNLDLQNSK